jgi:hypothetical protein
VPPFSDSTGPKCKAYHLCMNVQLLVLILMIVIRCPKVGTVQPKETSIAEHRLGKHISVAAIKQRLKAVFCVRNFNLGINVCVK